MFRVESHMGNAHVFTIIDRSVERSRTAVRKAFYFIGKENVKLAKKEILSKSKSGRVYLIRRGKTGRHYQHQASAPGEYPANMTGNLRKSIDFQVVGSGRMDFGSGGANHQGQAPYSLFLEKGTSKMKPRPFIRMTVEKNQVLAQNYFSRILAAEIMK